MTTITEVPYERKGLADWIAGGQTTKFKNVENTTNTTVLKPGGKRASIEDVRQVAIEMQSILERGKKQAILDSQAKKDAEIKKRRNKRYDQEGLDNLAQRGLLFEGNLTFAKSITVFDAENNTREEISVNTLLINRSTEMYPEEWTLFLPTNPKDAIKFNPNNNA